MKKYLMILVSIFIFLIAYNYFLVEQTDAIKFKKEYENINDLRKLEIDKQNPFIYKTTFDIIEMIDNEESFLVYFGFPTCPWCRSVIETVIESAREQKIGKIYYVDIKDIRDTISIDNEGNFIKEKKPKEWYYDLVGKLDNVLEYYYITDEAGNKINTGNKRIYAPNLISVVEGKAVKIETGISELQKESNQEITKEIKKDMKSKFKKLFLTQHTSVCHSVDPC